MKTKEQDYVDKNIDNDKAVAYNVNNDLMSVRDLQKDFDTSLLNPDKAAAYHELHGTQAPERPVTTELKEKEETVEV